LAEPKSATVAGETPSAARPDAPETSAKEKIGPMRSG
jgi:hypothetical protein